MKRTNDEAGDGNGKIGDPGHAGARVRDPLPLSEVREVLGPIPPARHEKPRPEPTGKTESGPRGRARVEEPKAGAVVAPEPAKAIWQDGDVLEPSSAASAVAESPSDLPTPPRWPNSVAPSRPHTIPSLERGHDVKSLLELLAEPPETFVPIVGGNLLAEGRSLAIVGTVPLLGAVLSLAAGQILGETAFGAQTFGPPRRWLLLQTEAPHGLLTEHVHQLRKRIGAHRFETVSKSLFVHLLNDRAVSDWTLDAMTPIRERTFEAVLEEKGAEIVVFCGLAGLSTRDLAEYSGMRGLAESLRKAVIQPDPKRAMVLAHSTDPSAGESPGSRALRHAVDAELTISQPATGGLEFKTTKP